MTAIANRKTTMNATAEAAAFSSLRFLCAVRARGIDRRVLVYLSVFLILSDCAAYASTSEVADAAMRGDREGVRAALARKADVTLAQVDGSTALHWAAERDDADMA